MLRQALLTSVLLSAIAGCGQSPVPFAPIAPQEAAPAAQAVTAASQVAAAAASGNAPQAPTSQVIASDRAAAQAGAVAPPTDWTEPHLLNPVNDPAISAYEAVAPTTVATSSPAFPGIHILRFAQVNPTLYRGGLPSESSLVAMKALGIKTDIDLMGEVPIFDTFLVAREKHWAKEANLKFVNIAVPTGKMPFGPKISDAYATSFLKVALDPANQPCYVHCLHGRDRTGTMVAVYRMAHDHLSNAAAIAEMESFGFSAKSYPKLYNFVLHYTPAAVPAAATP